MPGKAHRTWERSTAALDAHSASKSLGRRKHQSNSRAGGDGASGSNQRPRRTSPYVRQGTSARGSISGLPAKAQSGSRADAARLATEQEPQNSFLSLSASHLSS